MQMFCFHIIGFLKRNPGLRFREIQKKPCFGFELQKKRFFDKNMKPNERCESVLMNQVFFKLFKYQNNANFTVHLKPQNEV